MTDAWAAAYPYLIAILPTIGVAFLFYLVIKSMIEGDRRERRAVARWEAEHGRSLRPERPVVQKKGEIGTSGGEKPAPNGSENPSGT